MWLQFESESTLLPLRPPFDVHFDLRVVRTTFNFELRTSPSSHAQLLPTVPTGPTRGSPVSSLTWQHSFSRIHCDPTEPRIHRALVEAAVWATHTIFLRRSRRAVSESPFLGSRPFCRDFIPEIQARGSHTPDSLGLHVPAAPHPVNRMPGGPVAVPFAHSAPRFWHRRRLACGSPAVHSSSGLPPVATFFFVFSIERHSFPELRLLPRDPEPYRVVLLPLSPD